MYASLKRALPESTPLETAGIMGLGLGTGERIMVRRWVLIACVTVFGLLLNGCTKCGPIWDDWIQPSKSCRSDRLQGPEGT